MATTAGASGGRTSGNTIGDLLFMSKGVVRVVFRQVNDPRGLLQLAKAVKKYSQYQKLQKLSLHLQLAHLALRLLIPPQINLQ